MSGSPGKYAYAIYTMSRSKYFIFHMMSRWENVHPYRMVFVFGMDHREYRTSSALEI